MTKIKIVVAIIFLLCITIGSATAYTSNENFFSIDEPSGWIIDESAEGDFDVIFYAPTTDNESITLIEIYVETTSGSITLDELAESAREQYQLAFNNSLIISESIRVLNGVDAYEIVAAINTQGYDFMVNQVMMVRNSRIYVVSYVSTLRQYQQFLSDFENSIETFTIRDPIPWYFGYMFVIAIVAILSIIAAGLYFYKKREKSSFIRP